jgi:hypothetical protein
MSEINELQDLGGEDEQEQEAPSAVSPIVGASKSTTSIAC